MCFFQKWAKDLNKHFPKAQYRDGQKAHEKMLCVSNHHGDGHQRHRKIPSPTQEESYDQEKNNSSHFGQGCGKTKTLVHSVGMYNGTDAVENTLAVLQKIALESPRGPALLTIFQKV